MLTHGGGWGKGDSRARPLFWAAVGIQKLSFPKSYWLMFLANSLETSLSDYQTTLSQLKIH